MKTSVTEKESPGNLEEILRVKPKVEIVYQAIKYTGDNIHDIYRIFNGREIQFKVEDGWDGNISLRIKDHNANYYLTVGKYIIFSYYVNRDIPDNVCIRAVAENINEIKKREKDIDELLKLFETIGDKYTDIDTVTLRVQRDSISMCWELLPPSTSVEAREGDYIIFADNSWTIVKQENFDNEYVITEDIEELTDIHKDMEDFEFLGTKSVEIIVPLKYK